MKDTLCIISITAVCIGGIIATSTIENVVMGKRTTQFGIYGIWFSRNAADGVKDCNIVDDDHFSATSDSPYPWWQVDLGQQYSIKNIIVYGRTTDTPLQLQYFKLFLSNTEVDGSGTPFYVNEGFEDGGVYRIAVNKTTTRFIRITLSFRDVQDQIPDAPEVGALAICEVEAFVKGCDAYSYRDNCSQTCGQCHGSVTCKAENGHCPGGCLLPGFKPPTCKTRCDANSYGYNCSQTCGMCHGSVTCNAENGHCPGGCLLPGFKPPICKKECDDYSYGDNCSQTCGKCHGSDTCNADNGHCPGGCLLSGFKPPTCKTICDAMSYGVNCSQTCGKCHGSVTCNVENGYCPGGCLLPGFKPPICTKECDANSYGDNCSQTCGKCHGSVTCNAETGHCPGGCLLPGFKPPICTNECDANSYGINCNQTCGKCHGNNICNAGNGSCPGGCLLPGFKPPICKTVCDGNLYGANCNQTCGKCQENVACNAKNGHCPGGCLWAGFNPPICKNKCNNSFGENCNHKCHCVGDTPCHIVHGNCSDNECAAGYRGGNCSIIECSNNTFGKDCKHYCHCNDGTQCNIFHGNCTSNVCDHPYTGNNCSLELDESNDGEGDNNSSVTIGAVVSAFVVAALIVGIVFVLKRKGIIFAKSTPTQCRNEFVSLEDDVVKPQAVPIYQEVKKPKKKMNDETLSEKPMASNEYYSFAPRKADIKVHQIWDYIHDKMKEKCESFYKDFALLNYGLDDSHKIALLPENRAKNRYKEMFAYDHSRVPLVANCTGESEYINASFIDGYEKAAKFIASQGPIKVMIDDFWRMIWQQRSDTIVMLTNLVEFGSHKCIQYWPEKGEKSFERITVELVKTETFLDYNIRHLKIRQGNESPRAVTQYHFKSWPDKDVPDSAWCLVNFWRVVNRKHSTNDAGPIVVHCSAGVGRTGTYIAMDNLFNQANAEGSVRPLQMVETLRRQRVNMVQTKEQYVYLHEALAEALLFGTHYIWSNQFDDFCKYMSELDPTTTKVRLRIQYDLIVQSLRTEDGPSTSSESEYASVYEYEAASESDAYRPKRKNKRLKYIQDLDAVYLPNYSKANAYLVTASPNKKIMEEFWSLVNEQNVKTIVVMADTSHTNNKLTGRLATGSPNVHGKYTVNYLEEKHRKGFTESVLTFKESEKNDEDLATVKQFHYTAWKNGYNVPGDTQSMLDLVDAIHIWQPHATITQPIIIHCGNGENKRTGVVCVLLNELQRMRLDDGHINIVESVKTMKQRNKDIIANYEQYRYCHAVILAHIEQTNVRDVYQNI